MDEGQFFGDVTWMLEYRAREKCTVIVTRIMMDYVYVPIPPVVHLMVQAGAVKMLQGKCFYCTAKATCFLCFTSIRNSLVGGAEDYRPSCRQCFHIQSKLYPAGYPILG